MSKGGRDPTWSKGFDEKNLRTSLRDKTFDQVARELAELLSRREECIPGEIINVYLDVISQKAPPDEELDPDEDPDPEEALAGFYRRLYAEDFPEESPPRKVRHISPRRLMTAAILVVLALVLGGYATGFQWPKFLLNWRDELLVVESTESGAMELEDVAPDSYCSLRAAMDAYDLPNVEPKWIPADFSVLEVMTTEVAGRIDIVAVYSSADAREIIIRILVTGVPSNIGYEKNDDGKEEIYTTNGQEFQLTENLDQARITWFMENCYGSIYGAITKEEIKQMVNSIFKE